MSIEENTDLEQSRTSVSPGKFLADARESKGLSQKEVADELHITAHYVRSIENDAYEKLPGTIFAKGYIKRYAEILGLDVDEVLEAFASFQQDQQDQRNEVTRIHARRNRARNRNFAIASVLAFIALFVGLWAWNVMSVDPESVVDNRPENDVIGDRIASVLEEEGNNLQRESDLNVTTQPGISTPSSTDSGAPAAIPPEPAPDLQTPPSAVDSEQTPGSSMPIDLEESDITVIAISNEGDDVLRVSFDDDSFIQVSDENSNRIYRGTLGKGEVLEITDDAPFDVLISDAPLTHMTLNGTEVNIMESVRIDNSARLTVGL